jgi:hypothetical protein
MNRRSSMYWSALSLLVACADEAGPPGPPGTDVRPLLERTVDRKSTCTLGGGPVDQKPKSWNYGGHAVAARDGEVIVVRTESIRESPWDAAPTSLVFGALLEDGSLAGAETVAEVSEVGVSEPVAAVVGEELWMLWIDGTNLALARDTATGVVGPTSLGLPADESPWSSILELASGHDGAGLVYSKNDPSNGRSTLSFVRLDATGAIVGAPVVLSTQQERPVITLHATDDGWVMLLRRDGEVVSQRLAIDGAASPAIVLAKDDEGTQRFVGRGGGFDRGTLALVADGDGFVAAWAESTWSQEDAWSAVKLAKLDADGAIVGTPIWARAPEADVDEVEPNLTRHGDHVALTWARGSHIYICAGCIPDHDIQLVLFDPRAMTPVSDVATVPSFDSGGLLRRQEAWAGATLRMAIQVQFHVHGEPATAVVRCE